MSKIGIFMANGCEEVEGLTVVDLLRRAGIEIDMISITGQKEIESSHKVRFFADVLAEDVDFDTYDGVVLPGGLPGTNNLAANEIVTTQIKAFAQSGKLVAAVCAAPSVLGKNGILQGKRATCFPGFEEALEGAEFCTDQVVVDKNVITSRGMGTAIPFGLAIVRYLAGEEAASQLQNKIVFAK